MAVFYQSAQAAGIDIVPNPNFAGEVCVVRGVLSVPALVINDKLEMVILPANCVPCDFILDSDDLDTATTMTLDVGLMSGTPGDKDLARTVGTEFLSASTVGQAGGVARAATAGAMRIAATDTDRSIGILVKAAPTGQAGQIGFTLFYRDA